MPKTFRQWLPYALGGASFVALLLALLTPAPADTIPRQPVTARATAPAGYVKYWQGCGGGLHAAGAIGEAGSGPISGAVNGETAGVHILCDVQMGHGTGALVVGVEGDADTIFGDLHSTAKANWHWGGNLRAGVLVTPSTLFYGHGGWRRLELASNPIASSLDGWTGGAGFEVRLPTQMPFFLDTRYTYVAYDDPPKFPGVDVRSHELRVGFTWKFGPTYVPSVD